MPAIYQMEVDLTSWRPKWPNRFRVRPAGALHDAEQIAALSAYWRGLEPWIGPITKEFVGEHMEEFVVVREGDQVIASGQCVIYQNGRAKFRANYQHPDRLGQGLGTSIMNARSARARNYGCHAAYAYTVKVSFFEGQGWHVKRQTG